MKAGNMEPARTARIASIAIAGALLASCAFPMRPPPPTMHEVLRHRYREIARQAKEQSALDLKAAEDRQRIARGESQYTPTPGIDGNFERCIGGLPGCTPGLLTISQASQVRERWGPRDYQHCPAGWTNCDMSRRTPSDAQAHFRRDRDSQAQERRRSGPPYGSYGGYDGYGGGGFGGGCGSRGGPGYRLSNGKCASWRDVR